MIDKRKLERERLMRHEEFMSRSVKEIFGLKGPERAPRAERKPYPRKTIDPNLLCLYCKQPMRPGWSPADPKVYCSRSCKNKHRRAREKVAPSQLCPPGAGSGLETPPEGDTRGAG